MQFSFFFPSHHLVIIFSRNQFEPVYRVVAHWVVFSFYPDGSPGHHGADTTIDSGFRREDPDSLQQDLNSQSFIDLQIDLMYKASWPLSHEGLIDEFPV